MAKHALARKPDGAEVSVGAELSHNQGWQKINTYIGAGIGGLLLVSREATDYLKHGPPWVGSLFLTSLVAATVFLGRSYIGLVTAERRLTALQKANDLKDSDQIDDNDFAYPQDAYVCFWIAFLVTAFAGGLLIYSVWAYPK